ncbi:MAG: GHKL domain-containing protein [Flavobacteriales bacterium]|nr:GHKL domain-containing protein [Flavobacteriales bacterium]
MKYLSVILLILFSATYAQNLREIDSIKIYLQKSKDEIYNDKKQAVKYLNKAKEFYKPSYVETYLADIEYQTGVINYITADYKESLEHFLKALEIYQRNNKTSDIAKCYTGIGLVEMGIENTENARKYFIKSLKIKHPLSDRMNTANLFNLGILQMDAKQYDSAQYYFRKSYQLSLKSKRIDTEQMLLNRFGQLKLETNEIDSAFYYYKKLFNHTSPVSNWEKTAGHRGLAEYYLKKGNLFEAEKNAKIALGLALQIPSKWEVYKCYEILGEISVLNNNPLKAYEYLKLHNIYKDSVVNENTIRKIKYLQLQEKENENQRLALEKEQIESELKNYRFLLIFIVFVSIVLSLVVYLYKKQISMKNQHATELESINQTIAVKNQKLTEINQTKSILLSVLSHDLKSPLAGIDQVLTMSQHDFFSEEEKKNLLVQLQSQVKETINMLNNMIHWAQSQKEGFITNPSIINPETIIKNVINNLKLNAELKNIEIKLVIGHPIEFTFDPTHFQIIMQNLLNNAIKFSYSNSPIHIEITSMAHHYHIHVKDQGMGLSIQQMEKILSEKYQIDNIQYADADKSTGIGLTLVKSLLQLNRGKLEISSVPNKLTVFTICIPKE